VQDVEKAAKVSEKVVPNVIARSFATISVCPHLAPPHLLVEMASRTSHFFILPMLTVTEGITKPAIRRLARRGGVKRISGLIYEEVCPRPAVGPCIDG
jgi:hypothetical protein